MKRSRGPNAKTRNFIFRLCNPFLKKIISKNIKSGLTTEMIEYLKKWCKVSSVMPPELMTDIKFGKNILMKLKTLFCNDSIDNFDNTFTLILGSRSILLSPE